mmetsp:Transcript_982/g.1343  ORF Transcript_982/g.1343 Transcript_982/m.1343 type:complete len:115 (+) Transcript_982:241-585(+)
MPSRHSVPEVDPRKPGDPERGQILGVESLEPLAHAHVEKLGEQGERLREHRERDEHLLREEVRALFAWVQEAGEHGGDGQDDEPAQVNRHFLLKGVLVLRAQVHDVNVQAVSND